MGSGVLFKFTCSPQFLLELYWGRADLLHRYSLSLAMVLVDPQPVGWLSSLLSVLPSYYGSVWELLDLILAYGLTAWPGLGPASSPWYCLTIRALGWVCLPSPGLSCLPCLGTVGLIAGVVGSLLVHILTVHILTKQPCSCCLLTCCISNLNLKS